MLGLRYLRLCKYRNSYCYGITLSQKRYYDGDGKTTVTFLNRQSVDVITVSAYSKLGFRLSSGLFVLGPLIIFPKTILSWNVSGDDDINQDSLSLFYHLEPQVDVLVIGLGEDNSFKERSKFINKLQELRKTNLNFELLPTVKAISTYNFLCSENRFVAGAFIPPDRVELNTRDLFSSNLTDAFQGKDDYLIGDDCPEVDKANEKEAEKYIHPPDKIKKISSKELTQRALADVVNKKRER